MEEFKKKFILEAQDLIEELEESLLRLEENTNDSALIEQVFRAMHSLKGGGAMFGFETISNLTHHLETIYDLIRNGEKDLSNDIFSITLEAVDHLKSIVNTDVVEGELLDTHNSLLEKIINAVTSETQNKTSESVAEKESSNNEIKTFYIQFFPNEQIFNNGTNPMFLVEEIAQLGLCVAFPIFNIPQIENFNPEYCYTGWHILLSTVHDESDIQDIFIFVEDDCKIDIKIIATSNILNKDFIKKTEDLYKQNNEFSEKEIIELLENSFDKEINKEQTISDKVRKAASQNKSTSTISSIRVASEKLDNLMNLVSELVTTQARLSLFAEQKEDNELISIAENIQKLTRELRDNAFSIVLIPIEHLMTRFHRLVRDLNNDLNKTVKFTAHGTETELDKTIIESLADPLMHILRNSMDHGIETKEERAKTNKPEDGKIEFRAYHSGPNVIIQITDDGRGINTVAVREKAIEKGLITAEQNLTDREIFDLIFMPGFSTAKEISGVSGRGVGMDVVKKKISEVRGEIEIDSIEGEGTTIMIKLPLTLSIIDGLLIELANDYYILPLSAVDQIHAVNLPELRKINNNVFTLGNEQIPYYVMREELDLPEHDKEVLELIVVTFEALKIGLIVDTVVGEYQAVIKPLGKHYKDQDIISGATILGDGTIALVLDTNKAVKKFSKNINVLDEAIG